MQPVDPSGHLGAARVAGRTAAHCLAQPVQRAGSQRGPLQQHVAQAVCIPGARYQYRLWPPTALKLDSPELNE